eukprot:COSAG03_NODE_11890_length_571_cov_1.239407_2_plen_35_part_01
MASASARAFSIASLCVEPTSLSLGCPPRLGPVASQ